MNGRVAKRLRREAHAHRFGMQTHEYRTGPGGERQLTLGCIHGIYKAKKRIHKLQQRHA